MPIRITNIVLRSKRPHNFTTLKPCQDTFLFFGNRCKIGKNYVTLYLTRNLRKLFSHNFNISDELCRRLSIIYRCSISFVLKVDFMVFSTLLKIRRSEVELLVEKFKEDYGLYRFESLDEATSYGVKNWPTSKSEAKNNSGIQFKSRCNGVHVRVQNNSKTAFQTSVTVVLTHFDKKSLDAPKKILHYGNDISARQLQKVRPTSGQNFESEHWKRLVSILID